MKVGRGKAWIERHKERVRVRAKLDGALKTIASYPLAETESAEQYRDLWNRELERGAIEVNPRETLGGYGEAWIQNRAVNGSDHRARIKSIATERYTWGVHVAPSDLAKIQIKSITRRHMKAFALELRSRRAFSAVVKKGANGEKEIKRKLSDRTISASHQKQVLRLVRSCLTAAVEDGIIKENPAATVVVAIGSRPPKDKSEDWLREDEIEKLLSCEKLSLRDRTAYATAIGVGLRLSDIKSLRVDQIQDLEGATPYVSLTIEKTGKPHRAPIPAWLVPWLSRHLKTLAEIDRYVFPNRRHAKYGRWFDFSWAEKKSSKLDRHPSALAIAGVARKIGFHDLRATCATSLATGVWGRRWTLYEIQTMLAHSDQRVTERYVKKAVGSIDEAMRQTTGGPSAPEDDGPEADPDRGGTRQFPREFPAPGFRSSLDTN